VVAVLGCKRWEKDPGGWILLLFANVGLNSCRGLNLGYTHFQSKGKWGRTRAVTWLIFAGPVQCVLFFVVHPNSPAFFISSGDVRFNVFGSKS